MPFLTDVWYNPSSGYRASKKVRAALDLAHEQVASLIGAQPDEIIFTGCGTEANNTALQSLASMVGESHGKKRVVTSAIEHSSILRYADALAESGKFTVDHVGVGHDGRLVWEDYQRALSIGDAAMVSVMWANNETGVIQPIAKAAELARELKVPFHTDAIQAVGKTPVNVGEVPVDFLSMSGHKLHAPNGVGALYVRRGSAFYPMLRGGGQEKGRRSGTENVASIVGFGVAAAMMKSRLDAAKHLELASMRDYFEGRLLQEIEGVTVNGSKEHRTGNTSHVSFDSCDSAGLLILLDEYGVQCSAGSACMTGKQKPSHVQTAMGIPTEQAKTSLRISFSLFTTREECDAAVEAIKKAVKKLRSIQGGPHIGPVQVFTPKS